VTRLNLISVVPFVPCGYKAIQVHPQVIAYLNLRFDSPHHHHEKNREQTRAFRYFAHSVVSSRDASPKSRKLKTKDADCDSTTHAKPLSSQSRLTPFL
jgi:hypothetical protein